MGRLVRAGVPRRHRAPGYAARAGSTVPRHSPKPLRARPPQAETAAWAPIVKRVGFVPGQ